MGIDMARGLAMAGMTTVHFVALNQDTGRLNEAANLFSGRAMPLFMMLGGIGVTFLTRRSSTPERDLLIRAVMLYGLGILMTIYIDRLAIVLQAYGLFFVLATVLWRLKSWMLLTLIPIVTAIGAVSFQVVGDPINLTTYDESFTLSGVESLVFDGFYPLFPVGAFFIFGIVLGRIDLRSDDVAARLFGFGAVIGVGVHQLAGLFADVFDLQTNFGRRGNGMFEITRLLDGQGHSQMPVWVISALGTSAAVLGFSLLVAKRMPKMVQPLVAIGSLSLTYYVYQAWLTNLVPSTLETSIEAEWIITILVYLSGIGLAVIYKMIFKTGPLERVLRIGSGPKKPTPTQPEAVPTS